MHRRIKLPLITIVLGSTGLACTPAATISSAFAAPTDFSRPSIRLTSNDALEMAGDSINPFASAPHLTQELLPLAELARRELPHSDTETKAFAVVLRDARWPNVSDTAALLGWVAEYLQDRSLTELAKIGLLALRLPTIPNNPDRDYRAAFAKMSAASIRIRS